MLWAIVACFCWSSSARAEITYEAFTVESGVFILISGEFEPYDDPGDLVIEIAASNATAVSFDSRGGNIDKAMAYGKVIRALGLPTFQTIRKECSSACVYAFMGGVERIAGDGALGVHRSTVKLSEIPDAASAVAAVQEMTGHIIAYLEEMGVDPGLMQLILSVAHDEMRTLTAAEMEKYRVVTKAAKPVEAAPKTYERHEFISAYEAQNSANAVDRRAAEAMLSYMKYMGRNDDEAMAFWDKAYADIVQIEDIGIPKEILLRKKRQFFSEWPLRAYVVSPRQTSISCKRTCFITVFADWFRTNAAGDRTVSAATQINFHWDPKTETFFNEMEYSLGAVSEDQFKPIATMKDWETSGENCSLGDKKNDTTLFACDRWVALENALKSHGWCYKDDKQKTVEERWSACETTPAKKRAKITVAAPDRSGFVRPDKADFPAVRYTGKTAFPDYYGRDEAYYVARVAIRSAMLKRPDFGGQYSVITHKYSSGRPFIMIGNHITGEVHAAPTRAFGKDAKVDYRRDSRLMTVQSIHHDIDSCVITFLEVRDGEGTGDFWTMVDELDVGEPELCKRPIEKNLHK